MAIHELKLDLLGKVKNTEFQVRRKMLSKILEGELAANSKGKGIEFTGYRKYVYGDDASMIDWPASLRAKATLIREYEEYRNFPIYVMLDVSDSMLFSSHDKLKVEYAAELAFSIVYSVVNSGNKVGMGMFNDHLITKNPPQSGTKNYYKIMLDLQNKKNYGGKFSLKKALNETRTLLGERALIIIVSDFLGLEEGWEHYVRMMSQNFDILAIMVRDPRDNTMPDIKTQFLVEDPFTGEKLHIDTADYAKLYNEAAKKNEKEIKQKFQSAHAGVLSVETTTDFLRPLLKYMRVRAKLMSKVREGSI